MCAIFSTKNAEKLGQLLKVWPIPVLIRMMPNRGIAKRFYEISQPIIFADLCNKISFLSILAYRARATKTEINF